MSPDNPYRQLFRIKGVTGFFISGLIARFPQGMVTLGAVLMLNSTHGGFGLPSLVASTAILACALIAPQLSRLADTHGQTRIAIPAVCVALASYAGLIAASFLHWPDWALFINAIGIGFMPNFGAFSRARWSHLYTGTPLLRTAFALESLCEEMLWITGPLIVVQCATQLFPQAGLIAAAGLFTLGAVWFCTQTGSEPALRERQPQHGEKPVIFSTGVLLPSLALFALGGFFGVVEIAASAFAKQAGVPENTFYPLSAYAIGSLLTGIAYGLVHWKAPLPRQLLLVSILFVLTTVPYFFVANLWGLTFICFIAGATCSPSIIIALALVEHLVPKDRLTESMTWALVSPTIGMAAGFALTGKLVDTVGPEQAFYATVLFSVMAFVIVLLAQKRLSVSPERQNEENIPTRQAS